MKRYGTIKEQRGLYWTIPTINLVFAIVIWLINQSQLGLIGTGLCLVFCALYLLYYTTLSLKDSVICYYYNMLYMYFVFTLTYRKNIGTNAINWINIINVTLFFLLVKLIGDKSIRRELSCDPIAKIFTLFIVCFSLVSLFHGNKITDIVGVAFIYYRVLPIYIIVAYGKEQIKLNEIKTFLLQCVLPLPILYLYFSVDDFGGIFGILGVTPFSLITIFLFGMTIGYYLNNKLSLFQFLGLNAVFYLFWAVGEVKFAIMIAPVLEILLLFVRNSNKKNVDNRFLKKIFIFISAPVTLIVGFTVLLFFNEKWKDRIARVGIFDYIIYYATGATNHSEMSKFEVLNYAFNTILSSPLRKIMGLGIGSAMPPEMCLLQFRDEYLGRRNTYLSFYHTRIYSEYTYHLGYHNTAAATVMIESGICGILVFCILFAIIAFISWKLIKSKKSFHSIIGYAGVTFIVYLVPIFIYYNCVLRIRMFSTIMIIFGILMRYYRLEKEEVNNC